MIEAMKQALEALERSVATCFDQYAHRTVMSQPDHFINQAITSLRQAIAEFDSYTLYREGYVNGYAFGEAAGRKAIAEQDGDCQRCGGKGCIACDARKQKPVLWVMPDGKTVDKWGLQFYGGQTGTPLYAHKREWVGLTDEEKDDIWGNCLGIWDVLEETQKKLKEKNA